MKNKKTKIASYLLAILPILVVAVLYNRLPEQMPMHWNLDGTVEYDSKSLLWILSSMGLFFTVLFEVVPKIDPKKENYKKFSKSYDLFILALVIFMDVVLGITLVEGMMPNTIPVGKVVMLLLGALFIILGNILPKVKTNFYIGIRTPWALSDPDVWNRTQRLGGKLLFLLGVVTVISGFLFNQIACYVILMIGVVLMSVIVMVMSYRWYQEVQKGQKL